MRECETPKSPPGDYNAIMHAPSSEAHTLSRVKHLNPRQGITTGRVGIRPVNCPDVSV